MARPILILQNGDDCPPGTLGEQIVAAGMQYDLRELYAGAVLPEDTASHCAVVTLGGSMSAVDDANFPYLGAQVRLLRECIAAGVPVMGICLGSQILARACGARITQSAEPEYFFTPLQASLPSSDPVLGAPREWPRVMSWHFDMSELPEGAQLLASTDACPVQAYRLGPAQYGLQFHAEVTLPLLQLWIERFELEFGTGSSMDRVRGEIDELLQPAMQFGRQLFARWLALVSAR